MRIERLDCLNGNSAAADAEVDFAGVAYRQADVEAVVHASMNVDRAGARRYSFTEIQRGDGIHGQPLVFVNGETETNEGGVVSAGTVVKLNAVGDDIPAKGLPP